MFCTVYSTVQTQFYKDDSSILYDMRIKYYIPVAPLKIMHSLMRLINNKCLVIKNSAYLYNVHFDFVTLTAYTCRHKTFAAVHCTV